MSTRPTPAQITSQDISPQVPFIFRFTSVWSHKCPDQRVRNDVVCALGEFFGTGIFLFLALGGANFARLYHSSPLLTIVHIDVPSATQFLYIAISQVSMIRIENLI